MTLRLMIATLLVWLAIELLPQPKTYAKPSGERRTTLYPGTCPNDSSWYLIESTDDSITVGCIDPDYEEPEQ
jgi:hypothetical protein